MKNLWESIPPERLPLRMPRWSFQEWILARGVTVKLTIFSFNTVTRLIPLHGGAGGRVHSKTVNQWKNLKYTVCLIRMGI